MSVSTPQGRFIVFEGGEGCGKSTQARLLAEHLCNQGHQALLTREPGGTPGAEAIRQLLLDPPGEGWGLRAEALLFAAARSDHVEKAIRPALAKGKWVICDRFVDSSRAYQGYAGGLGDDVVMALHQAGSQALRPDLTFLMTLDEGRAQTRLDERDGGNSDAIGGRDAEYHRAVASGFDQIAAGDPSGYALIDGSGSMEDVHAAVLAAIEQHGFSQCS